jgi:predicted oxidoreductase (fatty acid repression mutant protein)
VKNENDVNSSTSSNAYNISSENNDKFQEIVLQTLQNLIDREEEKDKEKSNRNQWQEAGAVLDRFIQCNILPISYSRY